MTDVGVQTGAAVHQNPGHTLAGALERAFSRMLRGLAYTQVWEDPFTDRVALGSAEIDGIATIASGSRNVHSYLSTNPRSICRLLTSLSAS